MIFGLSIREAALIVAVIALLGYLYAIRMSAAEAIAALERGGYTRIELLGTSCRVARAFDRQGQPVDAYACALGETRSAADAERLDWLLQRGEKAEK